MSVRYTAWGELIGTLTHLRKCADVENRKRNGYDEGRKMKTR
jgi:hypothetical protein